MIFYIYLVVLSISSGYLIYSTAGSNTLLTAVVATTYGFIVAATTAKNIAIFAKTAHQDVEMKRTFLAQCFVVWMLACLERSMLETGFTSTGAERKV